MKRTLIIAGVLCSFAGAAMAEEYYVVENPTTHKCSIVSQKPTTTTETVVGNTVYKTREEAESGMKTVKVCSDSTTGSGSSTTTIRR